MKHEHMKKKIPSVHWFNYRSRTINVQRGKLIFIQSNILYTWNQNLNSVRF